MSRLSQTRPGSGGHALRIPKPRADLTGAIAWGGAGGAVERLPRSLAGRDALSAWRLAGEHQVRLGARLDDVLADPRRVDGLPLLVIAALALQAATVRC